MKIKSVLRGILEIDDKVKKKRKLKRHEISKRESQARPSQMKGRKW
jgi:hypothetical protein